MRVNLVESVVLILTIVTTPAALASGIDLHWMWDDRCAECHDHAGSFSRKYLSVSGGKLQGRHHVNDLKRFLHNHYLAATEVDAVYDMLLAQASTQQRFKNECASCHGTAAQFVRDKLELREGELYGRNSGLLVRSFLENHRKLTPNDVDFFDELMTRVAHEIYGP